jgi:hypothetical protein
VHLDATTAECLVFTFKEGLLSAFAHDLKIRVTRFVIDVDETGRVGEARFDAHSLRVVSAMQDGVESPDTLSDDDKRQIERNIVHDVLAGERHPEIRYVATAAVERDEALDIDGRLTLHGVERPLAARARRDADRYVAEIWLHQPDFGIRPYSALLCALRVKPDVLVRVEARIPWQRP